jgi:hypothetical protein
MPEDQPNPFATPAAWDVAAGPPPPPPASSSQLLYELRPLSLGEILDRTFAVYKRRFWLFAGLSTVAAGCSTLITLANLLMGTRTAFAPLAPRPANPAVDMRYVAIGAVTILIGLMLYLVAFGVTQAATVSAVSAVYVGEETSLGIAFRKVRRHWFRYILIMLWQGWSAIWLPLALIIPAAFLVSIPSLAIAGGLLIFLGVLSLIYSPFAAIRNSLGIVASAVEDLKVRRAMRRSKDLVAGHKARVLAIFLLAWVLGMVAGIGQSIFTTWGQFSHGAFRIVLDAIALLITFLSTAMVTPVSAIALCLFYIDERVRKEGFDLEVLMARAGGAPAPPSTPPPSTDLPSPFTSELA